MACVFPYKKKNPKLNDRVFKYFQIEWLPAKQLNYYNSYTLHRTIKQLLQVTHNLNHVAKAYW